jgi:hypothetical protein
MEVQDIHVGHQLHVAASPDSLNPIPNPTRDPIALGVAPATIPGSIFASGCVLVGNPLSYPAIAEAAVMISRPSAGMNPFATKVPSLLKVTTKANIPPTPLDVMFGDPGVGMVGITINSMTINIIESVAINIATPTLNITGVKNHAGANNKVGAESQTGARAKTGAEAKAGASCESNIKKVTGPQTTLMINGALFTGYSQRNKPFDISHPKEKGKRIRHICAEGPEAGIYIRGKLKGTHIIDIPEYWQGLVDYDTITVNLTPCGKPDLSLYVKEIREDKIILSSDHLTQVECFYQVWVARWINPDNHDEKLHVVYDGESPADYPEDNSHYTMGVH